MRHENVKVECLMRRTRLDQARNSTARSLKFFDELVSAKFPCVLIRQNGGAENGGRFHTLAHQAEALRRFLLIDSMSQKRHFTGNVI
jgi:hypothetical protein